MVKTEEVLKRIKQKVNEVAPTARVFLYGSYARGQQNKESDLDILILINKEKITYEDEVNIKYPIYDIEFETGIIISPILLSKVDWVSRHSKTPFYSNVNKEGIEL